MGELAGAGRPDLFNAAQLETQSLHVECEAIKAELKRHRAEHQSTEGLGEKSWATEEEAFEKAKEWANRKIARRMDNSATQN
jgi:hypothetical protein